MSADAILALHDRIKALESQVEDLRHVLLCLCLQVQPVAGTGRLVKAASVGELNGLHVLGTLLESQEVEVGKLANLLIDAAMTAVGEPVRFTREDLAAALEIVRERQQKNRPRLPPAEQAQ